MARVTGVTIDSHVDEITAEMQTKINSWLEAIGQDAASTAANQAPVDTGRLKNSISHAVVEDEKAVYIGTNVEYAVYQELGTSRGIPGKHFLQFGATAHADEYKSLLENILKE
jgi:hypothetical protein